MSTQATFHEGDMSADYSRVELEEDSQAGKPRELASRISLKSSAVMGLVTASCGGDESATPVVGDQAPTGETGDPAQRKPKSESEAARFLLRATFAVTAKEISNIMKAGYETWLTNQIDQPVGQPAAEFYSAGGFDQIDNNLYFDRPQSADQMIWNQLIAGDNNVRKRIALALSEFFVVSVNRLSMRWPAIAIGHYWDILNHHAFGSFRDLLEEITLCPATGVFLDTRGNQKSDPATGREPDENYAREVMQLFTIGLYELEHDGSTKTADGRPIETYSNQDIKGLAKCLTGYDFDFSEVEIHPHPGNPDWPVEDPSYARRRLTADPARWRIPSSESLHSGEEKSFLGVTVPAGTSANETLEIALDTLFNHSNVGPFFGRQMIQRLVTSNPSKAYVGRVASAFNDNGSGQRGDLRSVFLAVLLDEEALSEEGLENPSFGKLREPILRFAQWGRTFKASSQSGNWLIDALTRDYDQLAQSPLRSPSVFNFFRPSFVPANSDLAMNGLVAPEFQLVNETSIAGYVNFIQDAIVGRSYSTRDVKATYEDELEVAHDAQALLDRLDLILTANQLSENSRSVILEALQERFVGPDSQIEERLRRVHLAVILVMTSPDYLVQR